jgi:hypothetical protein
MNCTNGWQAPEDQLSNSLLIDFLYLYLLFLSIPTIEQAFSTMNIVKTRLCNKVKNEFLINYLILYIERELLLGDLVHIQS